MEKDGDKNEDRLKSLETDFSNSNFSPGDEKADETEAGVGLEVDEKENCEQNAKQKKPRNSGERCGAKFGESRPSQRGGHASKTSCRAKKQTGALAWFRRDKVGLFVPRSCVWRQSFVLPCALRVLAGFCCFSRNNSVAVERKMKKPKHRLARGRIVFLEGAGGRVEIF